MPRAIDGLRRRALRVFEGEAPALAVACARVALALIVLIRTTDWGRGVVAFHHHEWVSGIEYAPSVDPVTAPALVSPLLPGLALGSDATWLLTTLRTLSALLLLVGVVPRANCVLLAIAGAWLMGADRYRYLHHLYLLWSMVAWFSLLPSGERLSLPSWLLKRRGRTRVPRWSLQLVRLFAASVYFAAGAAKLRVAWLSGTTLRDLERVTWIGGAAWHQVVATLGYAPLAWLVCVTELSLGPLLLFRRTRLLGVAVGVALHLSVMVSMEVSTFNAQMLLLLSLFLIRDRAGTPNAATTASA